jgi:hypothetical protein
MRRCSIPRLILAAAGLLCTTILAAQSVPSVSQSPSFGTAGLTYVRLSGLDFFPFESAAGYRPNFSIRRYPVASSFLIAPLHLPGGSIVDYLQIDFCDQRDPQDIHLKMLECDPYGTDCVLVANVNSFGNPDCSTISTSGFSHQVDNLGHALFLQAEFQSLDDFALTLAGAVVGYRLQVSPAPATATFNDVPTSHPFFQFIEALAASGITGGCNASPPLYCPDAPLTRGQMAVFLAKGLGLHFQ